MTDDPFDLRDRVVVVTGGNGGIGLGMADGLARAGAAVAVWGTNAGKNEAAVSALERHGSEVASWVCDVGDEEQVETTFAATVARFGRVDAAFANAGIGSDGSESFLSMTAATWRRMLRVNLDGTFFTFRAAARHMVQRGGGGSLVALSSVAAVHGQPRGQHYAATKAGVIAMCRAIGVELGPQGVRANAILPGWIESPMTDALFQWDRFVDRVLPRVPLGRWGRPEDLAGLAVYLASDASRYHTGDTFVIDGGYTMF